MKKKLLIIRVLVVFLSTISIVGQSFTVAEGTYLVMNGGVTVDYSGGDFMSLRRYKKDTYSPLSMNGEEVQLHWANADQYYIKSSEN